MRKCWGERVAKLIINEHGVKKRNTWARVREIGRNLAHAKQQALKVEYGKNDGVKSHTEEIVLSLNRKKQLLGCHANCYEVFVGNMIS